MTIKQFLKPNWRKILLTILIGILAFLIFMESRIYCEPCALEKKCVCPYSLPQLLSFPIFVFGPQSNSWIIILSSIPYWYFLSCLIVWIFDKVRVKSKILTLDKIIKHSRAKWRYILIIVILTSLVGVGILEYTKYVTREMTSLSRLPELKIPQKIVEKETVDWKTSKNEEIEIEFEYPEGWGDITFQSQKNEVYTFESPNETIEVIWYHKPSGIIAFVIRGEKYEQEFGGENYQDILKLIYPNKEIKTIYALSPQMVQWYGNIGSINFSLDGRYIYFIISAYEYSEPVIVNINSGLNIIEDYDIWFYDTYEHIFWSPNNNVLAIRSYTNDMIGTGIDGLFVSDYDNPEKLNKVFSFSGEEHISGSNLYDIYFADDERLLFSVFLKKCRYEQEWKCYEEKTTKYEYIVRTKELREIK